MTKEVVNEKRYYWLDILKIIACFCVLVNHIGLFGLTKAHYSFSEVLFYCIQFALCKIGVPLFIMVSGYLYLTSEKSNNFTYKTILKRIFRIIVPLILMTLLLTVKENGIKDFNILLFIKNFINKPYVVAYWYLYMLIGLYIITPFIKKMIDKFKSIDYIIFLIMFLILPAAISFITKFFNIGISSYFTQAFFPIIIAYYISGVYIAKLEKSNKKLILSIIIFIISTILFFLTLYLPYLKTNAISYLFDGYKSIFCVFQSLSIFYIIYHLFENKKFGKRLSTIISETSKVTFGIYLTHFTIVNRVYNFAPIHRIFMYNANIGILCIEVSIFIICGIATYILRKIPVIKKFL